MGEQRDTIMATRAFKYVKYRESYYPLIPLRLIGSSKVLVYALIDSGATVSLFHISLAEHAGIELGDAEPVYLAGIGGYVKALLKKNVEVEVDGIGRLVIPIAFTEYVASDIAVLGRQGFFEALEITFRESLREVVLSRIISTS